MTPESKIGDYLELSPEKSNCTTKILCEGCFNILAQNYEIWDGGSTVEADWYLIDVSICFFQKLLERASVWNELK